MQPHDDPRSPASGATAGRMAHLDDLDDYKVADGEPDIRGWSVRTSDGLDVGRVSDLVVDTGAMVVRYLEVRLDSAGAADDRRVLVPVASARLNDDDDVVTIDLAATRVAALPAYRRGMAPDGDDRMPAGRADDRRFFGTRRAGREGDAYIVRSEERLAVGKRVAEAGAVHVRKRVETEHVREDVPVMREEVTVERRPIPPGEAARAGSAEIRDGEIRVPVREEQIVTEKRVVPVEEVVIRKEAVRGEETVEADLRKERVDVDTPDTRRPPPDRP